MELNHALQENNKIMSFYSFKEETSIDRRKKIMVIDDDQDFRLLLCEMLVEAGFTVTTAKDGEVALNNLIYGKEYPDLILVDIIMPVKTGLEFRQEQLLINEINDIPVIFMSGKYAETDLACILKPFDELEFIDLIKKSLG